MTEENKQQDTSTENQNKTPETTAPSDNAEKPKLNLEQGVPDNIQYPLAASIKNDASYTNRNNAFSLVNKNNHLSYAIRDGHMNLVANKLSSFKLDGRMGATQSTSREYEIKTNRVKCYFDDMLFNGHKFNPVFYEYANYKQYKDQNNNIHTVGGLCVSGSVMVRAWDEQLGRNMLIRRPARFPMFAPLNNVPTIDPALHIFDPSEYKELFDTTQDQSTSAEGWFNAVSAKFKEKQDESASNNSENTSDTDNEQSPDNSNNSENDQESNNDTNSSNTPTLNENAQLVGRKADSFINGFPDKVYETTDAISKDRSASLKEMDSVFDKQMDIYKEEYNKKKKDNPDKKDEYKKQYEEQKQALRQNFSEVKANVKNYYSKKKEELELKQKQKKEENKKKEDVKQQENK